MPPSLTSPVVLALPFTGCWMAKNSPARRIPSHGSHLLATTYAIDFVKVDNAASGGARGSWRAIVGSEAAELFPGFGQPILSPVDGVIAAVHDGEPDHVARRSPFTALPYLLGQRRRLRSGIPAIAGNHILISLEDRQAVVGLMHLRRASIRVRVGQRVRSGELLGLCGNSGNSLQPHLHVQAMDGIDPANSSGLPISFASFHERPRGAAQFQQRRLAVPAEGSVIKPSAL